VRLWIVIALLAGSTVAAVRHAMGHRHPIVIPLLLFPALVLGWQEWTFRADEATFSVVATGIAGRDVQIQCQRFTGALLDPTAEAGYVQFNADGTPTDTGRLERDACRDLRAYLHSDRSNPTLQQVIAVQVLAHESYHLSGISDEARTECAAIQRIDHVAVELGATPDQGRLIAERYYDDVYPQMPTAYRDVECKEDGELDASPNDGQWP
jgi:hypothetical protein